MKPIPSLVKLPDPGIEHGSPALQMDSLPTELSGKNCFFLRQSSKLGEQPKWSVYFLFYYSGFFKDVFQG